MHDHRSGSDQDRIVNQASQTWARDPSTVPELGQGTGEGWAGPGFGFYISRDQNRNRLRTGCLKREKLCVA